MLYCSCGYSCGVQRALDKHIRYYSGEPEEARHTPVLDLLSQPARHPKPRGSFEPPSRNSSGASLRQESDAPLQRPMKKSLLIQTPEPPSNRDAAASLPLPKLECHPLSPSRFARPPSAGARPSLPEITLPTSPPGPLSCPATSRGSTSARQCSGTATSSTAPVLRIVFVRHAQSGNKCRRPGATAAKDPGLSEKGQSQAAALGEKLLSLYGAERESLLVVSSPMRRCLLTILPAVKLLGLPPEQCLCHGACFEYGCAGKDYKGSTPIEITGDFPEFKPVCFSSEGFWDYRGESGKETEEECRARGGRVAQWLGNIGAARKLEISNNGDGDAAEVKPPLVLVLVTHQTLSDLLCHIVIERSDERWEYGDIHYRFENAEVKEVILRQDGSAGFIS